MIHPVTGTPQDKRRIGNHPCCLRGRHYLASAMKALVEQGPAHAPELTPASIAKARRLKEAS